MQHGDIFNCTCLCVSVPFKFLKPCHRSCVFLLCWYVFGISTSSSNIKVIGQGQAHSSSLLAVRRWSTFSRKAVLFVNISGLLEDLPYAYQQGICQFDLAACRFQWLRWKAPVLFLCDMWCLKQA